jgi:hypothetical protein
MHVHGPRHKQCQLFPVIKFDSIMELHQISIHVKKSSLFIFKYSNQMKWRYYSIMKNTLFD